jgi:hypothetical protein
MLWGENHKRPRYRSVGFGDPRKYAIKVTDMVSRKDVIFTIVDWTEDEKRVAVAQIKRLAELPDEVARDITDKIEPSEPSRNH